MINSWGSKMSNINLLILLVLYFTTSAQAQNSINDFNGTDVATNLDFKNKELPYGYSQIDTLPADYPKIDILEINNPSPGLIMFPSSGKGFGNYLTFLDSAGKVIKYKKLTSNASNFSLQSNGLILFNQSSRGFFKAYSEAKIFVADTSLEVVDSIISSNGYKPSPHCSIILPNGNYLYTSFEAHNIDMSKVVPEGNPNAVVAGAVLVELDINKNPVFIWNSWEHIPINDTYQPINDFLNVTTLYSNFNSVDVDYEGNYLLSNRLLSEITKIDRNTGKILWRLGGKHNQFTFINEDDKEDNIYFSMQHDIRILPNGHITIFDNGEQYKTQSSRAVEYEIDEMNLTAKKVWEFNPDPLIFAASAGSAQRLSNGNTIMGWGNSNAVVPKRDITEVDAQGNVVFEVALPANNITFKALKFPYPLINTAAQVSWQELLPNNTYVFDNDDQKTGVTLIYKYIEGSLSMYNSLEVSKYNFAPVYPQFSIPTPYVLPYRYWFEYTNIDTLYAEIRFKVTDLNLMKIPDQFTVFVRDSIGKGYFEPLTTTYDNNTNELIAYTSKLGEFIFGRIDNQIKPLAPSLIYPKQNDILNKNNKVEFSWNPKGYFSSSRIVIAEDKEFSKIIKIDSNLKSTKYIVDNLASNKKYFWKVSVTNDFEYSDWSDVFDFILGDEFIKIIYPAGGEKFIADSVRKFINWEKNINDPVKIELLRNNEKIHTIIDSLVSFTGAYAWIIPSSIPEDSNYTIKITCLKDTSLFSVCKDKFSINNPTTGIGDYSDVDFYTISPNPASDYIEINLGNIILSEAKDLKIYNSLGECVISVGAIHEPIDRRSLLPLQRIDISALSPGLYFININNGKEMLTGSFIVIR
jgi:hypothetical protein